MLTSEDTPTIRHAIEKRLGKERGIEVNDVLCEVAEDCIQVQVLVRVDRRVHCASRFDLPDPFDHGHLLNEIDELAEHYKAVRGDYWRNGRHIDGVQNIVGTGLRGGWKRYG